MPDNFKGVNKNIPDTLFFEEQYYPSIPEWSALGDIGAVFLPILKNTYGYIPFFSSSGYVKLQSSGNTYNSTYKQYYAGYAECVSFKINNDRLYGISIDSLYIGYNKESGGPSISTTAKRGYVRLVKDVK